MTFKDLALLIAELEVGKKEIDIAQIREILSRLKLLFKEDPIEVLKVLVK